MNNFKAALECLAEDQGELEGFEAALSYVEKDKAFTQITKDYDDALMTVVALEEIQKVVNAGNTHDKGNFAPNPGFIDSILDGVLTLVGSSFGNHANVAKEEFKIMPVEKQLVYVQEEITEWIERIWSAIRTFLAKVWNWIKSLFAYRSDKQKKKLEDQAHKRRLIDELRRDRDTMIKTLVGGSKSGGVHIRQIGGDVIIKSGGKEWRLNDPNSPEASALRARLEVVRAVIRNGNGIATESSDTVADSLIMVLDAVANMKPHYQSSQAYYLLNAEAIREGTGTKEEMFKALEYTKKTVNQINKYVGSYLIDPAKDAIRILNASEFDEGKAIDVLKKMVPSANELNARMGNIGKVIEGMVVLPDFVGTEGMSFHCASVDIEEVFKESVSMGDVMTEIGFYRGSRVNFPAEKPMVELCMTSACVDRSSQLGVDLFLAFEDMVDVATKYDTVIKDLQKVVEKVSRNEALAGNRQVMNFSKLVLHCLSAYLNQPFAHVNAVVPRVLDALIDHTKNSNLCADPESVIATL